MLLSLPWGSRVFFNPANAGFHKTHKIFQGTWGSKRVHEKYVQEELHADEYYCLLYQMQQEADPNALCTKAAVKSVQKAAISDGVHEWDTFPSSSFPKAPVNHSKRHTLYRCGHMCWVCCICKFTTLGTKNHLIVLFPPWWLTMSKLLLTGLLYLVKVLLALWKLTFARFADYVEEIWLCQVLLTI